MANLFDLRCCFLLLCLACQLACQINNQNEGLADGNDILSDGQSDPLGDLDRGTDAGDTSDQNSYDSNPFLPLASSNPALGASAAATMHTDTVSSDASLQSGPGSNQLHAIHQDLYGACSTVLIRSDGIPMVLCTAWVGRNPTVQILDPESAQSLAKLALPAGSLLGGVYAYLDNLDRLVMVDGVHNLVRVAASQTNNQGPWEIKVEQSVSLAQVVTGHCGASDCDAVVAISPDGDGAVWFATQAGLVGIYDPARDSLETTQLAEDEMIHNSFSTTNDGRAAIASDHALYLLVKDDAAKPQVMWREAYDRGSARKPGQLSYGTGATPSFFGPTDGTDFVTITDNADRQMSLMVYRAGVDSFGSAERLVCKLPIFESNASGTENSAIAAGRSIFVASTYGYPYPAVPDGAGPAVPESADFVGGMVRVDVRPNGTGCELIWQNDVRSTAVPKLSVTDELIYTIELDATDTYHFVVVDPHLGNVIKSIALGSGQLKNTLQMAGNFTQQGDYWQGSVAGIFRISSQ